MNSKKILQIDTNGQVGWELLRTCAPSSEVVALDYPNVDLSDYAGLRKLAHEMASNEYGMYLLRFADEMKK